MTGRPTLYGTRHAVSAGHYLATAAGFAVLEAGGNAVDAGVAAGITLGVVQSDIVNVAGVAPIILRMADGRMETIAGLGHWPMAFPADLFQRAHGGKMPPGVLRTVVPAAPDAWITALQRHGTMGFAEVAEAAIRHARDGFAMHPTMASNLVAKQAAYQRWPSTAAIYLPGGRPPAVGDKFIQADLGAMLQHMADEDRAARAGGRAAGLAAAHAAFYRGDIAARIVAFQAEQGGYLAREDLAGFRSRIEPPVTRAWRGHAISTCGPWCQGPALLEALLVAERIGMDGLAHNSPAWLHLIAEALKAALADREYHFGDPAMVEVPLAALLSETHIAARAASFRADAACPAMPPPLLSNGPPIPPETRVKLPEVEADTSYVCVVDRWGNAFSATPSDGSWNAPVVPGLGIVPSARGSQSRPDPAHPCGVAPGKRPRLTPNPALAVLADGGVMPFGTPGGDVQVQAMLQVLLNILHFGMEVQEAIEAPRIATYAFPSSFAPFEYFPRRLAVEGRIPRATRDALAALGHEIQDWPGWAYAAGSVEAIRTDPATGLLAAGADPRRPAYAIAS
ncbi:gamma-glutamyltransferase family protein [Falsiroseomonas selenitidurans]|uniref:Gamma-glutamyltransferase family protein n=1 Tax=Falsiroseomonas selenitidurans TaxID=2716335 RepID=A0ABX1E3Z0_9PROT|nr:gamma-glutamyltransferase [Falsiroseomonas selenitidurans]NKC30232.1 gamma-glutamyltransferase family protein [Falsiroseomonas selenitidurans]